MCPVYVEGEFDVDVCTKCIEIQHRAQRLKTLKTHFEWTVEQHEAGNK